MTDKDVLYEAIEGFRKLRESLGLQLDHSWGNVTDAEFEERAKPYLAETKPADLDLLARKLVVLHQATDTWLDQEEVSSIFRCSFEEAAQAMVASVDAKVPTPAGLRAESLLQGLVLSAGRGSLCTGEGRHHISPEFLKAWKEARDFLFADEEARLAAIEEKTG